MPIYHPEELLLVLCYDENLSPIRIHCNFIYMIYLATTDEDIILEINELNNIAKLEALPADLVLEFFFVPKDILSVT